MEFNSVFKGLNNSAFTVLPSGTYSLCTTLTEVFPCFFLSCKANARVKPAKTGHGPHSSSCCVVLCIFCVVLCIYVFYVLFVFWRSLYCLCICVLNNCHRVATQLQLNISYHYALRVEKNYQHGLDARPLELQFLRPRGCVDKSGSSCLKIPVILTNPKDVHNGSPLYITHKKIYNYFTSHTGAPGCAVGWGTALQTGKSRVRFPKVSLECFIDTILPAALRPWDRLSL
jgi:hypothetical protein